MARSSGPFRRTLRRATTGLLGLLVLSAAAFGGLWVTLPDPAPLAKAPPATTALIEQRRAEARAKKRPFHPQRTFVPLEHLPRHLVAAVLASEDARFFDHEGIDWTATREAAEHDLSRGHFARGASTITQQLAKNLWLGTEKSLWRKAKEAVLAWKLERSLQKRRILTLYLNVVELGDGVFGVESGARARFGVSAPGLSLAQSVVLASMLPAPRKVNLDEPSTWIKRRSRRLLDRLLQEGRVSAEDHLRASAELERILAGPRPAQDEDEPPEDDSAGGDDKGEG